MVRTAVHVDTVIVGAGFGGLAVAAALDRAGRGDYLILERADRVGGTWRDNTYPGVGCDIPAHLYSFSFLPEPAWPSVYAAGADIQAYLERAADELGLRRRLRLGTALIGADWDEAEERWHVATTTGPLVARSLVVAAGRLAEPAVPELPFDGPSFHTGRWDHSADLVGKRVAVVGTGASAVQVVPRLAEIAEVTVFQRSPAWVLPRDDRSYTEVERTEFAAHPERLVLLRADLFDQAESLFAARVDPLARQTLEALARGHLANQVTDPELRAALTPDYELGCKRAVFSNDFYPALAGGAVLEPSAVVGARGRTLIAASGREHEVDAVVWATGFQTQRPPYARLIRGEHGTLAAHWTGGMRAYAATLVAGFPSLFVVGGPNAGLGHHSAIELLEAQADFVASAGSELVQVSAEAEDAWTAEVDRRAARTVWLSGCRSWYVDPDSNRLTLVWPGTVQDFRDRLATDILALDPALP